MVTRINSVEAGWDDFEPDDLQDGSITPVGGESRLSWGEPTDDTGAQSYISIVGMMPPIRVVSTSTKFRLLKFRYSRTDIEVSDGSFLDEAVVTADVAFDGEDVETVTVTLLHNPVTGVFRLQGGFPQELVVGDRTLLLLGFEIPGEGTKSTFSASVGQTVTAYLLVQLIDEPLVEDTGDAVFTSDRCEIPYIPPISTLPLIADCAVPDTIEPIVDCPEIDLPAVASIGLAVGLPGDPGPQGPTGPPGPPGCDTLVTATYQHYCVTDCRQVKVTIKRFVLDDCWTHFHFTFWLCCPPPYYPEESDCCTWVWCPCPEELDDSPGTEYDSPSVDNNCPKTDTCTDAPGYWVALDADCEHHPPCTVGEFYGQAQLTCTCPDSSSSSSSISDDSSPDPEDPESYGPWDPCCDGVDLPETLILNSVPGGFSSCPRWLITDLVLTRVFEACWTGETEDGKAVSFCCTETAEGEFQFELTATWNGGPGCVFILSNTPERCSGGDGFLWSASGIGNRGICCDELPSGVGVTVTFYVTEA